MKNKITFVISSFGKGSLQSDGSPDPFIDAIQNSIRNIYPNTDDVKIIISCNGLPEDDMNRINDKIHKVREECNFLKVSPGSLKLVTHYEAWKYIDTEWAVFLDSDMLLLKPLDQYLTDDVDYIFTWRPKDMSQGGWPWLNAGTMICRNTPAVRNFWSKYYDGMWEQALKYSKGDQFAFVDLLENFDKRIERGKVLLNTPRHHIFKFNEHDINFSAIHVDYLNRSDGYADWFEETTIQHLKGILGTVITKTEKENRYNAFLANLDRMDENKRKNLKIRIDLWKKFAPKEIADGVINL